MELTDDFRGDNAKLINCIEALIDLSDKGALVPHGIGGHARTMLAAAAVRLSPTLSATEAPGEDAISLVDAFEIGWGFAFEVSRPQSKEDSRAVGRLLGSDLFAPIAKQIRTAEREVGFNPFESAEHGIVQAKAIIHRALEALSPALLEECREVLDWYREQARLCRLIHSEGDAGRHALSKDGGKRASALLAKLPKAK